MKPISLQTLAPLQLSRLLDVDHCAIWTPEDGAAALEHQLAAPLWPDLELIAGIQNEPNRRQTNAQQSQTTFREQLTGDDSTVQVLQWIKRFGRHMRDDQASPLRGAPATVIYFAAIGAALVNHQCRITTLSNGELAAGFSWSQMQQGAEPLSELFSYAVARCQSLFNPMRASSHDALPHRSSWRG